MGVVETSAKIWLAGDGCRRRRRSRWVRWMVVGVFGGGGGEEASCEGRVAMELGHFFGFVCWGCLRR